MMKNGTSRPENAELFDGIVLFGESAEKVAQSLRDFGTSIALANSKAIEAAAENEIMLWRKANGFSED